MSDVAKDAWRKYLIQLQAPPLRTKAITAGELEAITARVLVGCSYANAKKISGIKKLQIRRFLLLMLYGFTYAGPFGHFLHKLMEILLRGKKGSRSVAMQYGLSHRSWVSVTDKVRNVYPSVQLTAWKFSPIVGWLNYQYMPVQFPSWAIFLNIKVRSAATPAIKTA